MRNRKQTATKTYLHTLRRHDRFGVVRELEARLLRLVAVGDSVVIEGVLWMVVKARKR